MENKNLISIIIPCFNAELYLSEAIESIINQTYKNIEIIAINDGSTDNTLTILKQLKIRDNRIIIIDNKQNLGLIDSLNIGVRKAKGKYIARMDSDDISILNRLEVQQKHLEKHNLDLISSAFQVINSKGQKIKKAVFKQNYSKSCLFQSFFSNPITHPSLLIKADILKENLYGSPNSLHTEDFELWNRLAIKGYKIGNAKEILLLYRNLENSLSSKFEKIQIENHVLISKDRIKKYFDLNMTWNTALILNNRISNLCEFSDFKKANNILSIMRKTISKTSIIEQEKKEIATIYSNQIIDISIQAILKFKFKLKLAALYLLISNSPSIIANGGLSYIKSKI